MIENKLYLFQKGHPGYWKGKNIPLKTRIKIGRALEKHPQWKGGKTIHQGYIMVKRPDHPYCRKSGYIMEHRIIMENKIGRYLLKNEKVHHKDENKLNNNPPNLILNSNNISHIKKFHLKNKRCDIKYQKVIFYLKEGLSRRKIGKIFNCSHNVIKRILMESKDA